MDMTFFLTIFFIIKTIANFHAAPQQHIAQTLASKTINVSITATPTASLTPSFSPSHAAPTSIPQTIAPTQTFLPSATPTPPATAVSSVKIDSLSPNEASFGDTFTVKGTGFGNTAKNVWFYGPTGYNVGGGSILSWNDTEIKTQVPAVQGNLTFQIEVENANGTRSNKVSMNVKGGQPYIESISPNEPVMEQTIIISGKGYGSSNGMVKLSDPSSTNAVATCNINSWSDTQIVCTVPNIVNKEYGIQIVAADGRASSLTYRNVKCNPNGCG